MKPNQAGYEHAQRLIGEQKVVLDERDDWSADRPSAQDENRFVEAHGIRAFGTWHLGIDEESGPETKGHYTFPYGDLENVHRRAVLAAESRAGEYKHYDIERAACHLLGMLDELMNLAAPPP